jgi:hypothetical protein
MVYQGKVINGVVVFDGPVAPPEGTQVSVEAVHEKSSTESTVDNDLLHMSDLAVETGIPDLSTNIDHYLYGQPKLQHSQ